MIAVKRSHLLLQISAKQYSRSFSIEASKFSEEKYKLVIVGAGAGGLASGSKFARKLGAKNVAIIDPAKYHYYQAGWTLAGGGITKAEKYTKLQEDFIPRDLKLNKIKWFQSKCSAFEPEKNCVYLENGKKINYEYMIVATGLYTDFDAIKGIKEALENDSKVVSIYSPTYVNKVFSAIQNFKQGNAIFTFPVMPIKCPGAPQKIMYLTEDYFRKNNLREKATVIYNTTLPVIFGVKKYAARLMEIVKDRNIQLNLRTSLVEIDYKNNLAIFEKLDSPGTFVKYNYSLLHVAPPMKPISEIRNSKLVDSTGFVDVIKETLQHKKYPNVYALGDCTNMPTSKTAAAVAAQSYIVFKNLSSTMNNQEPKVQYDGYTSCPLVTGYGKTILAEFDFVGNPLETFPFDQGEQRRTMYHLKKDLMAPIYWYGLVRGLWNGPGFYRKLFRVLKPNV